jgi:ketosteroid isomerase-like protein
MMRRYGRIVLALAFSLSLGAGQTASQEPAISLPPELARVLTDYEKAWRAKDASALADLFSADGMVLSPGSLMVRGRSAIRKYYTGAGGSLFLRAVAYAVYGDVGYIIGGYTDRSGAPDIGKFTLTLTKDRSGRWLIKSDMDNSNRRAAASPPPER